MITKPKGGYAFPSDISLGDEQWSADAGMSLRDYFAAKAMNGEIAAMCSTEDEDNSGIDLSISDSHLDLLVTHWYRIADAMLRIRSK